MGISERALESKYAQLSMEFPLHIKVKIFIEPIKVDNILTVRLLACQNKGNPLNSKTVWNADFCPQIHIILRISILIGGTVS